MSFYHCHEYQYVSLVSKLLSYSLTEYDSNTVMTPYFHLVLQTVAAPGANFFFGGGGGGAIEGQTNFLGGQLRGKQIFLGGQLGGNQFSFESV